MCPRANARRPLTPFAIASGREARYGSLAARAATLTVPRDVPLKDPSRYRLIGTRVSGVDNRKVVTGQPLFGIDVRLPDMNSQPSPSARCSTAAR